MTYELAQKINETVPAWEAGMGGVDFAEIGSAPERAHEKRSGGLTAQK